MASSWRWPRLSAALAGGRVVFGRLDFRIAEVDVVEAYGPILDDGDRRLAAGMLHCSVSTSTTRCAEADDIVIITIVMDSIPRLIRMFMQYMNRLVRSPAFRSPAICEASHIVSP